LSFRSQFRSLYEGNSHAYNIFGIDVDRKHTLKWLFPQDKATFHGAQEVHVFSVNAIHVA
jgi:hypothetical protein